MGKVYACSDLHGMLDMLNAVCKSLQPDDIVYFLGDAGDRGPHCWETIKKVAEHPQFIYLKGNHEDMLVKALKTYRLYQDESRMYQEPFDEEQFYRCHDYRLLQMNGGSRTFEECIAEGEINKWIKYLDELPLFKTYVRKDGKKVYLSHAGFSPTEEDSIPSQHVLLWDRTHFYDEWDEEKQEDCFIVHGHTPILYMVADLHGEITKEDEDATDWYPYIYADGHKVCIDAGAFFTGDFILLDLDDFKESSIFRIPKYLSN